MTSALATESMLRGAGVGDESASVLAAAFAWLLKDGTGMLSKILFTWLSSSKLDSDCKKWRLIADILNDLAFSLDLIAPVFPTLFTPIICMSSVVRSIVGVAGCATRSVVTQHQAKVENAADVAAKDGAQETFVNVIALIYSLLLLPLITGHRLTTWTFYFAFTAVHLYANYRAVTSLNFRTFNRNLLHIVTKNYVEKGRILSVEQANASEPLFHDIPGRRYYGRSLVDVLNIDKYHDKFIMETDFAVLYRDGIRKEKIVYIAIASTSDFETQITAAFYAEYALVTGNFPPKSTVEKFLYGCRTMGWSMTNHRLQYDQWTFTRKID